MLKLSHAEYSQIMVLLFQDIMKCTELFVISSPPFLIPLQAIDTAIVTLKQFIHSQGFVCFYFKSWCDKYFIHNGFSLL